MNDRKCIYRHLKWFKIIICKYKKCIQIFQVLILQTVLYALMHTTIFLKLFIFILHVFLTSSLDYNLFGFGIALVYQTKTALHKRKNNNKTHNSITDNNNCRGFLFEFKLVLEYWNQCSYQVIERLDGSNR